MIFVHFPNRTKHVDLSAVTCTYLLVSRAFSLACRLLARHLAPARRYHFGTLTRDKTTTSVILDVAVTDIGRFVSSCYDVDKGKLPRGLPLDPTRPRGHFLMPQLFDRNDTWSIHENVGFSYKSFAKFPTSWLKSLNKFHVTIERIEPYLVRFPT